MRAAIRARLVPVEDLRVYQRETNDWCSLGKIDPGQRAVLVVEKEVGEGHARATRRENRQLGRRLACTANTHATVAPSLVLVQTKMLPRKAGMQVKQRPLYCIMGTMSTELPGNLASAPLERAIARVVQTMRPEAIYLFGSRARGDADADSDYDLLVIVPDDAPSVHARWKRRRVSPATPEFRSTSFPAAAASSSASGSMSARSATAPRTRAGWSMADSGLPDWLTVVDDDLSDR